jgi:hypothetical protein
MSIPVEKLLVKLGYPEMEPSIQSTILPFDRVTAGNLNLSSDRLARVNEILLELDRVDALLAEARQNSMAKDLGTMKLDFTYHINSLKVDGSILLTELGQLCRLPVFYDRYLGDYPASSTFYTIFGIQRPVVGAVYTQW